jgi:hypothetical protein
MARHGDRRGGGDNRSETDDQKTAAAHDHSFLHRADA